MCKTSRIIIALLCAAMLHTMPVPEAESRQREIRILHMNDFHGFADEHREFGSDEVVGGIAYAAWRADTLRKEKPTLLVAAGDMIQGNNWTNFFHGKPVIEVMNAMRFDAMALGNHEFDFGQAMLKERIAEAHFPVLCANIEGIEGVKPYIVKEVRGIRVGMIGVLTEDTAVTTHPKNVVGLKFSSLFEAVEKCVKELKGKADIIIVLSHAGLNQDMLLASRVEGIDVIVGGHTHTRLAAPLNINNTVIIQAGEHGIVLGVLDLVVRDKRIVGAKGRLEEIRPANMKKLRSVAAIVDTYKRKIDSIMDQTIGETSVDLDGKNVRLRETNLGNFVAEIMREKTGADGTIINGGGIRTSINKGPLTVKDIYSALPFDNYVVVVRLTGKQIIDTLEHGVSAVEDEAGRFPQVSGIAFTYSKKGVKGKRVGEVVVGGKPIDPNGVYAIATNDFIAAGGDGYRAFGNAATSSGSYSAAGGAMKGENIVYSDAGTWVRDLVLEFIRSQRIISPCVEGRIRELP